MDVHYVHISHAHQHVRGLGHESWVHGVFSTCGAGAPMSAGMFRAVQGRGCGTLTFTEYLRREQNTAYSGVIHTSDVNRAFSLRAPT